MDNNIYIFLCITLVTSPTTDLTPNFSESNCIYPYCKWYNICSNGINSYAALRIIIQTLDYMLHHYPGFGKFQLPISCLDDVLEKWWYKITYYVLSKLIIEMGMAVYRVAVVSVA